MLCVTAGPLLSSVPGEKQSLTLRAPWDQCPQQITQTDLPRNWNAKAQQEKVKPVYFHTEVYAKYSARESTPSQKESLLAFSLHD